MSSKKVVKKPIYKRKRFYLLLGLIIIFTFVIAAYLKIAFMKPPDFPGELKQLSLEQLKIYNGTSPDLPIYMGYEGKIYDVTEGAGFYAAGKTYNYLTGRDSTKELDEVGVGEIIKRKYPVIGEIKE